MADAVLSVALQYTPPGGTVNSGTLSKQLTVPSNAQNVGYIDVPDATPALTSYAIPFGSIGVGARALVIHNTLNQAVTVTVNGTQWGDVAAGAVVMVGMTADPTANPILSAAIATTALQSGLGQLAYYVFGT